MDIGIQKEMRYISRLYNDIVYVVFRIINRWIRRRARWFRRVLLVVGEKSFIDGRAFFSIIRYTYYKYSWSLNMICTFWVLVRCWGRYRTRRRCGHRFIQMRLRDIRLIGGKALKPANAFYSYQRVFSFQSVHCSQISGPINFLYLL